MNDHIHLLRLLQPRLIQNIWKLEKDYRVAQIIGATHPEGIEAKRIRFKGGGQFIVAKHLAHIISFSSGKGILHIEGESYVVKGGTHCYIPRNADVEIEASEYGLEFVQASSRNAAGKKFLLRLESQLRNSPRWVETSQYLSRRIFLHNDKTLLSKSGYPVGWFHTTMFDTSASPLNIDGQPVFKMQYNSRTEFNIVYRVIGDAAVRFGNHPYEKQDWSHWHELNDSSTYHLNETEDEAEIVGDNKSSDLHLLRNRHEVSISEGGSVSLFCLFDPSPVGMERHTPGEYTDYPPFEEVVGTPEYAAFQEMIKIADAKIDSRSMEESRLEEVNA